MISDKEYKHLKIKTLQYYWGHSAFKNYQEEIIDSVLNQKNCIALLPTGAGKSLCFQLPALLLDGTCIVISPLIALMKDQVYSLKQKNVEAEFISSELEDHQMVDILTRCKEGLTKLLYVSPERLNNSLFLNEIQDVKISFLAVDEAHCISEWGADFRPSYQNIKHFRDTFSGLTTIALTATATPKVLNEIQEKLDLRNPMIFQKSFERDNISIFIDKVADKYQWVLDFMKYQNGTGIIYTRTRKEAENLTYFLKNKNIENVNFYHAGLSKKDKNERQKEWQRSSNNTLIATNAFGMGIDKDNVRFIIHYSASSSIENYYQEIGRAGRDGHISYAFLLWNEQEIQNFDDIIKNSIPNRSEFVKIISALYSTYQVADGELPDKTFQFNINQLQRRVKCSMAKIKTVLNFLNHQEIIYYNHYKSLSSIQLKILPEELELVSSQDAYFMEILLRNIPGIGTRKVLFNENKLSERMNIELLLIKERIRDLVDKDYIDYVDGALSSIRFVEHRNARKTEGQYWKLFFQIQKNKIQKWEDMKYFFKDHSHCKMQLILSYFGEKNTKPCGKCSYCQAKKEPLFGTDISTDIIQTLSKKPCNIDQIAIQLHYYQKDNILENLILLLDQGKVKMLDFRTYTIA